MSASRSSSEGSDFHNSFDENSDGGCSAASSLAPHLQGRPKRTRPTQIRGKAWVLRGDIFIPVRHNNSLSDCESSDVVEEHVQMIKTHLEAAFGAKFENLFQRMLENI